MTVRGEPALALLTVLTLTVPRPTHRALSAGGGSQTIRGAGDSLVEGAPKVGSAGGSITAAAVLSLLHGRLAPLLDAPVHALGVVIAVLSVSTELEDVVFELSVTVGLIPIGLVADVVNDAGRLIRKKPLIFLKTGYLK